MRYPSILLFAWLAGVLSIPAGTEHFTWITYGSILLAVILGRLLAFMDAPPVTVHGEPDK